MARDNAVDFLASLELEQIGTWLGDVLRYVSLKTKDSERQERLAELKAAVDAWDRNELHLELSEAIVSVIDRRINIAHAGGFAPEAQG